MKLKKKYTSLNDVPEFARFMYEEDDGAYVPKEGVDVDAVSAGFGNDSRDEFRDRNRALQAEVDKMKSELGDYRKQFEGVDADQFRKFQEQLAQIAEDEERKLIAAGNIDEVVKRRTAATVSDLRKEIEARDNAYKDLDARYQRTNETLTTMQAQEAVSRLIGDKGLRVRPGAVEDLNARIAADWTTSDDGQLTPRRSDLLGEDGSAIMPPEYVEKELLGKRAFFFEPAKGGGAQGADDRPAAQKGLIARNPRDMGRNLESIAKGEMEVE